MIQANELRIGNWYKQLAVGVYTQVTLFLFHELYDDETYLDYLQPIRLTPEILEKCGFKEDDKWFKLKENPVQVFYDCEQVAYESFLLDVRIKSLHQLQNLYWCLCGEELEIKL